MIIAPNKNNDDNPLILGYIYFILPAANHVGIVKNLQCAVYYLYRLHTFSEGKLHTTNDDEAATISITTEKEVEEPPSAFISS